MGEMGARSLFPLLSFCLFLSLVMAESPYARETEKWRQAYQARLKAPDGWLAVAGLSWLREGTNSVGSDASNDVVLPPRFPAHLGSITLTGRSAVLQSPAGRQQFEAEKEPIAFHDISLALIERNHRFAIRVRDPQAPTLRHFTGSRWFPLREEYRIEAKWTPYHTPKTIPIVSILGYSEDEPTPGYAEFTLHGKTFRLEPVIEEPGSLFFIFKDETAGHETYGAGRFLDAPDPKDGKVILDFNQSRNPPCAFTAFATCPLPPRQNFLATRIEAGELKYGNH